MSHRGRWNDPGAAGFPLSFCQAANGDLTAAVTFLTEEQAQEPVGDVTAREPAPWEGSAVGKRLRHGES